jgi:hypothetical protein
MIGDVVGDVGSGDVVGDVRAGDAVLADGGPGGG